MSRLCPTCFVPFPTQHFRNWMSCCPCVWGGGYCVGSSRALLNLWIIGWAAEMHSHPSTQGQKQTCCVVFGTLGEGPSQAPAISLQSFIQLTLTYFFLPVAHFKHLLLLHVVSLLGKIVNECPLLTKHMRSISQTRKHSWLS